MSEHAPGIGLLITPAARRALAACCPFRRAALRTGGTSCCVPDTRQGREPPPGTQPPDDVPGWSCTVIGTGVLDAVPDPARRERVLLDVRPAPVPGPAVPATDGLFFVLVALPG